MTRWNYMPNTRTRSGKKAKIEDLPYIDRMAILAKESDPEANTRFLNGNTTKYHSKKVEVDGITFDSKKEARRYEELRTLEAMGVITDLELQKKFVLIPTQREPDTVGPRGGIKKGKVLEKECSYYADFYYYDTQKEEWIVEDTKSPATRTEAYKIKRKLMRYIHHIEIQEV